MALGRELVRNLELDDRGAILERWIAHHIAELLLAAERAKGAEKVEAEARAADLILRLWARRHDLPAAADPLGRYREAIAVLSRLVPDRSPWAAYARHSGPEQVFHNLFECMGRIVVCGLLLTLERLPRPVSPVEKCSMAPEERALMEQLEWWEKVIRPDVPVAVRSVADLDDNLAVTATSTGEQEATPAAGILRPIEKDPPCESEEVGGNGEGDDEKALDGNDADAGSIAQAEFKLRAQEELTEELERLQREVASLVEHWRLKSENS